MRIAIRKCRCQSLPLLILLITQLQLLYCRLIRNADGLTTIKLIRQSEHKAEASEQLTATAGGSHSAANSPRPMDAVEREREREREPQAVPMDSECNGSEEAAFRHMH